LQKDGGRKVEELIATLEAKLSAAEENFRNLDGTLKREIEWVLSNKHSLVHKQTIFCMCCYRDFYKRASDEFGRVVDQLDVDLRKDALKKLADAHASGPLAPVDLRSAAEKIYDRGQAKLDAKATAAAQVLEKRAERKKIAKQNREIRSRIADTSANMTLGGGSGTIPPPPPPVGAKGILESRGGGAVYAGGIAPNTPPGSDAEGDEDVINPLAGMPGMDLSRARALSLKSSSAASDGGRPLVAQFSYEAAEEGELAFEQGDVVVVTAEDESGWGMGHLKGRPEVEGVFPLNYLSDTAQGTWL